MRLSTKIKYTLRAIIELANHYEKRPITIKWIAARQGISISYLEQILSQMRKAGFITSIKGPGGGYRLVQPPEKIKVHDIIKLLDGEEFIIACLEQTISECEGVSLCVPERYWRNIAKMLEELLRDVTVADICTEQKKTEKKRKQRRKPKRV
ncbi:MAG: hypothetical protein B6D65_00585 [candidate division Zixibacteria bacterium 4484_93]|mgnify:CR=1 FL=1|nr:MAG: hypothetical protein B6D65_00585 [candidate division Zixibacteria bacterium 4484_93]RKZ33598.1 MAG: Rrf2 family transcriptional regulator [bacterium]